MRKGRQTLCNVNRPDDIVSSVDLIEKRSTISLIDRLIQNAHQTQQPIKSVASHETATNRINQPNVNLKLFESVECWPSVRQQKAQTCQKKSQKKTCTTNQSHFETQTSTKKTPAPNCNYKQNRKTYSGRCDGNPDCINIDTNTAEWYIQLASNCYRNGFELHVNHLDECSKNPSVLCAKPVPAKAAAAAEPFLRLPSSALFHRSEPTQFNSNSDTKFSLVADLVVCSSPKSVRVAPHCNTKYSSNSLSDKTTTHRRPHQLNTAEINRIYRKNFAHACELFRYQFNRPINETTTLPIIIDTIPIAQPYAETERQFNALNAKNNMNSVAVDANNLPQNLQLSCQAIQYNYPNNNLTFYREFQANGQPEPRTIAESNNYRNHWIDESGPNSISLNNRIEVRSTATETETATADIVNDLIEAFNSSFDVSDSNQIKLPQIILSDFSSDLSTPPPTTPLFNATQSTATQPLSDQYSHQQQEFQLSKRFQLPSNAITHNNNLHIY